MFKHWSSFYKGTACIVDISGSIDCTFVVNVNSSEYYFIRILILLIHSGAILSE